MISISHSRFTLIVLLSYTTSSIFITQFHFKFSNNYGFTPYTIDRNLIKDTSTIFQLEDGRESTLFAGINKFKEYPNLNKIIGTGWYSSRVTLNQDKDDIKPGDYRNKKIFWTPAILAYPLDTGLLGIVLSIYMLLVNLKII